MKKIFIPVIFACGIFFSCDLDTDTNYDPILRTVAEQFTIDSTLIEQYLIEDSIDATMAESGLFYSIDTLGIGEYPSLNSVVKVDYIGKLLNGRTFGQGTAENKALSVYILGWQEGIQLFKEGGEGKLIIPSKLGYGPYANGSIPPNSVLVFDIKLIEVKNL